MELLIEKNGIIYLIFWMPEQTENNIISYMTLWSEVTEGKNLNAINVLERRSDS